MAKKQKKKLKQLKKINKRAYQLFMESGEVHGKDLENWLIAEKEILGKKEKKKKLKAEKKLQKAEEKARKKEKKKIEKIKKKVISQGKAPKEKMVPRKSVCETTIKNNNQKKTAARKVVKI